MNGISRFFKPLIIAAFILFLLNVCDSSAEELMNEDLPGRGGIKVWEMLLHGAFNTTEQLETNIYLSKDEEKFDAITILRPSAGIEIPFRDNKISADYDADIFLYGKYNTENHIDHRVRGLAEINLTDYKITALDVYRDFTDRAADENSRRVGRQVNNFRAEVGAEFDQLNFDVGYSNVVEAYSQKDDIAQATLTYKDKERMSSIVDAAVGYKFLPKTSVFAEGDLGFINYFNSSLAPGSYFVNALLGLKGRPTSKISANIKGGIKYQHYDDSDILNDKPFFGPVASGGIDYNMTKDDIWNFGVLSSVYESNYANNNYYHASLVSLAYMHKFTRKLSLKPFGAYQLNLYPGESAENGVSAKRSDNIYAGGCSLKYDLQKWASAEVKYEFVKRDSRFLVFDYTDNKITFSGSVGF